MMIFKYKTGCVYKPIDYKKKKKRAGTSIKKWADSRTIEKKKKYQSKKKNTMTSSTIFFTGHCERYIFVAFK